MTSALREIGLRKAIKFGFISILMVFYKMIIFPQLRVLFLRILGAKIGKNVIIHDVNFFNYYRTGFKGLKVGDNCFIGNDSLIDLADRIEIYDHVTIAERVTILTHTNVGYKDHPLQKYFPSFTKPVIFNYGSFIGVCVTILPGAEIGKCAFVAAGSLVTEDIPEYSLAVGIPAKVVRRIGTED
jgi:acetyltransferase-like isoleucine patch superfamily enzyme